MIKKLYHQMLINMTRCLDRISMSNTVKPWRQSRRKQDLDDRGDDDDELLYLQGLIRCILCDLPYPRLLEVCPHCKAKSI